MLGAESLATDPAFAPGKARSRNRDRLNDAIEAITRTRPSSEWIEILNRAGVPSGPIYRIDEVFADPQVRQMGITRMIQSSESPRRGRQELVGQAVELSRTPWELRTPTPEKGEHTDAILATLGYDATAIADLRARGVI
jgi:formyl-CoA transferase